MIKDNIITLRQEIESLKRPNIGDVTIIAVTKTKSVDNIRDAIEAGIQDIGENKVQELEQKYNVMGEVVNYHMIGHLQTNKVKNVVGKVKLIHSVDRISLIEEIEKRCKSGGIEQEVLLQLNIAKEDSKYGAYLEDLEALIQKVETLEHIKVAGLMTIAPYYEDPEETRWIFRKMKETFEQLKLINYNNIKMSYLSMGMSHDFRIALQEGANMVRVGSYIFGDRIY